jgi:two-component system sensor histidine kinase/response regulator
LGCVDYITKPFEFEEVDARVRTQLSLAAMRDELAAYSKRLEQLVDERTCQLRKANERLSVLDKAKSDFLNLISHELRTPLTGIIGIAEYLIEKSNDEDMRRIFEHSCARIISVVDEAQHFTELSVMDRAVENGLVDVVAILRDEVVMLEDAAKERGVTVAVRDTACSVVGDQYWVPACARYLLKTAVRLAEPRAVVVAEASRESGACIIKVSVPHDPIDQNVCASFFELFGGGAATPDPHFGLAPALAQRYAALLRGNVTLVCNDGYAVLTAAIPQSV